MSSQRPMVNGDKPHSQTLDHITSYPLVSESIDFYQHSTLGAHSVALFNQLYATFGEPILPYLQTPYSIASPYLSKADELGDNSLSTFDNYFPSAKKTGFDDLKSDVSTAAHYPFKLTGETYDYVWNTYQDEYKKTGDQGILTLPKAVISTELRIISDTMRAVADYLGPKKDEAIAEAERLKKLGQEKASQAQQVAQNYADAAKGTANDKSQQAKQKKDQMVNSN